MFNLEASTIWWILTGVLVAAELFTGTFYLLLLALAAGFGALTVHAGFGTVTQISVAAVTGVFSLLVWRTLKLRPVEAERPRNRHRFIRYRPNGVCL